MYYSFDLTVPASTAETAPLVDEVELVPGTVTRVELQFPRGCVGLVHVKVFHAAHQVWPSNPGGAIAGDGSLVGWAEQWELDDKPSGLRLVAWNDDDTFPHTVTFRFALQAASGPEEEVPPPLTEQPAIELLELP